MSDFSHRSPLSKGFPMRLFLLLFTPVALLILGGAWYVGQEQIEEEMSMIRLSEISNVIMGVRRLDDELHTPLRQLRTLAGEEAVRDAVSSRGESDLEPMRAAFARLITYTDHYATIRWIDETGRERVRVNNVDGKAVATPEAALQALPERYFFKEGMRLKPGQVFISPMDLNVEQGRVEVPHKPTLRLLTPLHGGDGRPRGILVVNIAAQALLDAFTDSLMEARDHAMLLNDEGYWLLNPDSKLEWGFMFDRPNTLGRLNPPAWKALTGIPSGQVELDDGLWTWSTVYPLKVDDSQDTTSIPSWLVAAHMPREQLALFTRTTWQNVGAYMLVLLLLYAVLAAWLARAVTGRARAMADKAKAEAEAAAEHQLRQAQERFRLVVEANINGLLVVDQGGRIVLVNPALAAMFGYPAEELMGQSLEVLLPESARANHGRFFAAYMAHPVARPMGQGRELRGRRKDGSEFPIEISLSPFTENGETFVDAFIADISERQRSEQLHHTIEARLQLMMQTNPNGLLVVDDHGAIEMANPALERMFGYAPGELLNQPLERLVPKDSQHKHMDLRQEFMRTIDKRPMALGMNVQGLRKDGTTFPIRVNLASFVEDGRMYIQATVSGTDDLG